MAIGSNSPLKPIGRHRSLGLGGCHHLRSVPLAPPRAVCSVMTTTGPSKISGRATAPSSMGRKSRRRPPSVPATSSGSRHPSSRSGSGEPTHPNPSTAALERSFAPRPPSSASRKQAMSRSDPAGHEELQRAADQASGARRYPSGACRIHHHRRTLRPGSRSGLCPSPAAERGDLPPRGRRPGSGGQPIHVEDRGRFSRIAESGRRGHRQGPGGRRLRHRVPTSGSSGPRACSWPACVRLSPPHC